MLDNNIKAYALFIEIEIALREYLISLIIKGEVSNWTVQFLGSAQRDTIKTVIDKIKNVSVEKEDFEDVYLKKLNKVLQEFEANKIKNLHHPFYYLNWPDLEGLIRIKANNKLIDKSIGKDNREILTSLLLRLNGIRNDIAHSRIISLEQLGILERSHSYISEIIPNFKKLIQTQTIEESLIYLIPQIKQASLLLIGKKILEPKTILEIKNVIKISTQSFWFNAFYQHTVQLLSKMNLELIEYEKISQKVGGLLLVAKWKSRNELFLNELINKLDNE